MSRKRKSRKKRHRVRSRSEVTAARVPEEFAWLVVAPGSTSDPFARAGFRLLNDVSAIFTRDLVFGFPDPEVVYEGEFEGPGFKIQYIPQLSRLSKYSYDLSDTTDPSVSYAHALGLIYTRTGSEDHEPRLAINKMVPRYYQDVLGFLKKKKHTPEKGEKWGVRADCHTPEIRGKTYPAMPCMIAWKAKEAAEKMFKTLEAYGYFGVTQGAPLERWPMNPNAALSSVVENAFFFGYFVTRFQAWKAEAYARKGKTDKEIGERGGPREQKKAEERKARMYELADKVRVEHPDWNTQAIADEVSGRMDREGFTGCGKHTVYRRLLDRNKNSRSA